LREGIARAVHLVEQLLLLARQDPDAPMESARPVDLGALAREVAVAHQPEAAARGLDLTVEAEDGVTLTGDRTALRTLIDNLVDNAIRYTPSGRVALRVKNGDGGPVLEVEDTGPGIPQAERSRVFDRFYRGEAASEGGSGLGLAIVKRIAERHGGHVELLDSSRGGGLRARVAFLRPA
jgi:signal transduction histidine kinase